MERIIIVNRSTKSKEEIKLRFRLRDTHGVDLYHRSQISATLEKLDKFNNDGSLKKKVSVFDEELYGQIQDEIRIIREAYKKMKDTGLDLVSKNLEIAIEQIKNPEKPKETVGCLGDAFLEYTEVRKSRFSNIRYRQFLVLHKQLFRFLTIKGKRTITPQQFTPKDILDFREFLFDEFKYVEKWHYLYESMSLANIPKKRRAQTTVASSMKRLKAFFQQLEDEEIIAKSPFKKISSGDKRGLFKEELGLKKGLYQEEVKAIKDTKVPTYLQEVKDAFLLQCYIGCRIEDFVDMTMDRVVNEKGIPYIHYLPKKERDYAKSIDAPLVPSAMKIINDYQFSFKILRNINGKDGYNKRLKELFKVCGINRKIDDHLNDNKFTPLYEKASSNVARKTYLTLQDKYQVDHYFLGIHNRGSSAFENYVSEWMEDKYKLVCLMFDEECEALKTVQKGA